MDEQLLKNNIAQNLAYYRKLNNYTQAELAELLNYSDKSISKWERGEGIPDVMILYNLALHYNITINDFFSTKQLKPQNKSRQLLIVLLSSGLCWLTATVFFFCCKMFIPQFSESWLCFIIALPVNFIVLTVFARLWGSLLLRALCVSGITWTLILTIFLCLPYQHMYLLYIIAAIFQLLIIGWFLLQNKKKTAADKKIK